eukprot:scaffold2230_cov187-Amphora_coffeaeformis.AAC.7
MVNVLAPPMGDSLIRVIENSPNESTKTAESDKDEQFVHAVGGFLPDPDEPTLPRALPMVLRHINVVKAIMEQKKVRQVSEGPQ